MSRMTCTREGLALDGQPLYLLAGQLHYFRWPRAEWRERLLQARAAGLNTIDTVIPWNLHEPAEGILHFEGYADLPGYLDLIVELGLFAIVRPAPYICAEWENAGFPAWLTARLAPGENGLALRTADPRFLAPMERWFDRLIPLLAERQVDEGGPIILVQIENEHWASGVYGHDDYQQRQAEALVRRGITVPLYTCMGAGRSWPEFRNGWSGIAQKLEATRRAWPDNPMIVSELWSGWFDDWGSSRHDGRTAAALDWKLHELLAVGCAGFSHWMWAGGSHFGYWGGRTVGGDTIFMTTSYDYGAPVDEYGGLTPKFYAARRHHLFLNTLGSQVSRLMADASPGGARVVVPPAIPGRAASGAEPLRNVHLGPTTATFLQNPALERHTFQLFLPGQPPAHLAIEVDAGSVKPIYGNLPLGEQGLTLRWHTSHLLGFWSLPEGDVLVFHGFAGEVGQVGLAVPGGQAWRILDPDTAACDAAGEHLTISYWIGSTPTLVRVEAGHALTVVFLTGDRAARWWPLGEHGFLCGPDLVSEWEMSEDGLAIQCTGESLLPLLMIWPDGTARELPAPAVSAGRHTVLRPARWAQVDVVERSAEDGWQAMERPQPLEVLGCLLGYGWYRAEIEIAEPVVTTLTAPALADRATVLMDGQVAGVLGVGPGATGMALTLHLPAGRHDIRLLVDNLGRFNYGSNLGERKGLLDTLYWGGIQEDITKGWVALWQEATFAGEAIGGSQPAHVRPDAKDVDISCFPFSGPDVWLLREIHVPDGHRAVVVMTGDRNPGALFVNGRPVVRFSRHYGGGVIKEDVTALLRPGTNVLALHIQGYAGLPWRAWLLHYDQAQALQAQWSFRPGVTPATVPVPGGGGPSAPQFWRARFDYDEATDGPGPCRLSLRGMGKGQVWLNGHNAGRYWQIGPQEWTKLPQSWLQDHNELLLLEEQGRKPRDVFIEFGRRDQPWQVTIPLRPAAGQSGP